MLATVGAVPDISLVTTAAPKFSITAKTPFVTGTAEGVSALPNCVPELTCGLSNSMKRMS
jgi:hypothetical protein